MDQSSVRAILKTLLKNGDTVLLNVQGPSMLPVLKSGDKISVQKQESYSVGDIIVFVYLHGGFIVHRIISITDKVIYCKGDNSTRVEPILQRQILGKVIAATRDGTEINLYN